MSNQPVEINDREAHFPALIPFFVFVIFYLGLSLWANDFYKVPMPMAFLVASAAAMFLNRKRPLAEKVEIFASGMGEINIMLMCLIFVLAGAFASVAKGMGAVDSAVLVTRLVIPPNLMLAGIFLVACLISLSIGTSCGTIAALTPIAAGLIEQLGVRPEIMLGAVIGGAMFGDNLSMISDTTIAATRTQNVEMRDKFLANFKMVLPAAIVVAVIYLLIPAEAASAGEALRPANWMDFWNVLPYVLILVLALCGLNVMLLLFCGTVMACVIGMANGAFDLWKALGTCGSGILGMSETLIVAILAGGLLRLIRWNGGVAWLLQAISGKVRSPRGCEFGVAILTGAINLFTANNTVAIVIAGPVAKELSDRFGCVPKRIAGILDTASCVVQGVIPYGAQLLIAVGVAQEAGIRIATPQLLSSLYYPWVMFLALVAWIVIGSRERKN